MRIVCPGEKLSHIIPMQDAHCMPNPWVSLRRDQRGEGSLVNRLGEFSPIGWQFALDSYLKITKVAHILGLFFPRLRLRIYFDQKMVCATF
jgi:hypothetical protein